jgi:predicted NUDIX family NTP pyrophosphohydrolase
MAERSAGILVFRRTLPDPEVFLVHPGGPFWAKKDDGAWSIPKGLVTGSEDEIQAARREFLEEIGMPIDGELEHLGVFKQPSGKLVSAWCSEADIDASQVVSNEFELEWPPKSGLRKSFPEIDRAEWFSFARARTKLTKGQVPILLALASKLGVDVPTPAKLVHKSVDSDPQGSLF